MKATVSKQQITTLTLRYFHYINRDVLLYSVRSAPSQLQPVHHHHYFYLTRAPPHRSLVGTSTGSTAAGDLPLSVLYN
jgi:hypothetical protein